jgi:hypothetical protein
MKMGTTSTAGGKGPAWPRAQQYAGPVEQDGNSCWPTGYRHLNGTEKRDTYSR